MILGLLTNKLHILYDFTNISINNIDLINYKYYW
jgi:hypothetical protein